MSHVPHLAKADISGLRALASGTQVFQKGQPLIRASMPHSNAYLISSGCAASYRMLPNGRRQITNFLMPGDFVCLSAGISAIFGLLCRCDDSSLRDNLSRQFRKRFIPNVRWPWRGRSLLHGARGIHHRGTPHERGSANGARATHAYFDRALDSTSGSWPLLRLRFHFASLHRDIADAIALSDVHLSRTVKAIRERGLFEADFLRRHIAVLDANKAITESAFDTRYLWSACVLPELPFRVSKDSCYE
jgi:hypothetical protein